ncbi:hypothetical protein JCM6882_004787 [Rhodosporidiobolus microsporus]
MKPSTLVALLSASAASVLASTTSGASRLSGRSADADDPTGKTLYITEPACGYYRCIVTWPVGSAVAVNWLGPPAGKVSVSLASNIGGPEYKIVDSIASISQEGYCDAGYGMGVVAPGHECGRVEFVVPLKWERMDNYTIVVQSLSNPDLIGYTDMITISGPNSSLTVPNPPSGTAVSLLTIADPTSTNRGASTKFSGKIPAPTAVTGAGNKPTAGGAAAAAETTSTAVEKTRRVSSSSSAVDSSSGALLSSAASSTSPASAAGLNATAANVAAAAAASTAAGASPSATGAAPAGALVGRAAAALAGVAALAVLTL